MDSTTTFNSSIVASWPCLKPYGPSPSGTVQEISLPPPSRPSQRSLISALNSYSPHTPPWSFRTDTRQTSSAALLAVNLTGYPQMTQDLAGFPEQGANAPRPASPSEPFAEEADARVQDQGGMDVDDGADASEVKCMRKQRYLGAPLTVVSSGP